MNTKHLACKRQIEEYQCKFDVITLFHVFEHLENPREWLQIFSDKLNDGGLLVIEVPNANDILLSLYECEKFADFTYWSAHIYLYSPKSFGMLIKETDKFSILENAQIQRYPITNHLYWLAKGKPGGQNVWEVMNNEELNSAYVKKLQETETCDTLYFVLKKK